jgi:hypothetical protein
VAHLAEKVQGEGGQFPAGMAVRIADIDVRMPIPMKPPRHSEMMAPGIPT